MDGSIFLVIGITFAITVISFTIGALILSKKNKSGLSNQDEIANKNAQKMKRRPLWKWN
jgi:hypothetical protein